MQRAMRLGLELPEAPAFRPTAAEFADPIAYIRSIRAAAEEFGICRIIPPAEWKPPFAIDPATFRFNTRAQRIDRLQEATGAPLNANDQRLNQFVLTRHVALCLPVLSRRLRRWRLLHVRAVRAICQ